MGRNKKKLKRLKSDLASIGKHKQDGEILALKQKINQQLAEIGEVETRLPGNNGFYLRLIVGDLNLTLPTSELKRKYKESYEKWKMWCTLTIFAFSLFNLFFHHRFTDALHSFLLLWFYCTLTVRESILIVNGSRIRGWWVMHHYISAFLVGIHILWPADAPGYMNFRTKFVTFSLTVSLVQMLQYTYQSGLLYRLRSLGKVRDLHITIDGIQRWMFNDKDSIVLYILTPALTAVYIYQLYLSYGLFAIWFYSEPTEGPSNTWQVILMAILYFALAMGNTATLFLTLNHKERQKRIRTLSEVKKSD